MAKKYALLIGTSQFNDHRLQPLVAPVKDIHELGSVLNDDKFCGFDDVKYCLNSSLEEVRGAIARLFSQKMKDDLVLIYYTGHGIVDLRGRLYFALPNSDPSSPSAKSLNSSFIRQQMEDSSSSRQVVILDCCHSGAFGQNSNEMVGKDAGLVALNESTFDPMGHGRFVLSSSAAAERSFEQDGKSIYTHTLINGITKGVAAPDKAEISLDDLHQYLCKAVQERGAPMMPSFWADRDSQPIVFSKNPQRTVPIDPQLLQAVASGDHYSRLGAINHLEELAISGPGNRAEIVELLQRREDDGAERSDVSRAASRALDAIDQATKDAIVEQQSDFVSISEAEPPVADQSSSAPLGFAGNHEIVIGPTVNQDQNRIDETSALSKADNDRVLSGQVAKLAAILSAVITFVFLITIESSEVDFYGCAYSEAMIECGYLPWLSLITLFMAAMQVLLLHKLGYAFKKAAAAAAIFYATSFVMLILFDSSYMMGAAAILPMAIGLIVMGLTSNKKFQNFQSIAVVVGVAIGLTLLLEYSSQESGADGLYLIFFAFPLMFYVYYRNFATQY